MSHTHKLSLFSAVLININIMLGSGIFINTVLLTKQSGSLGAAIYLLVGILLLPLIWAIAKLLEYNDSSGTFYDFGLAVSPFFGFLTSWAYFTAKLCSSALGTHVSLSFLQQIIPALQVIPILLFDVIVLALFVLLNLQNLRFGKTIQYSFIVLKLIPILFVLLTGIYVFSGANFSATTLQFEGIPLSIPLVLYAFSGFEASCSLSSNIQNAKKNGPLAIFISYAIVVTIAFLFQLFFYGSLGTFLGTLTGGYLEAFPAYLQKFDFTLAAFKMGLQTLLHLAIASSSLGSAYGIMYSNSWNLYTLAHHNHTFFKKLLTKFNQHSVPAACVVIEGIIAIAYILISKGNQLPLQQISALGGTIAYTLSSIALIMLIYKKEQKIQAMPLLSLASCSLLIASYIYIISTKGPTMMLIAFIGLLFFGSLMFYRKHDVDTPLDVFEEL